MKIFAALEKMYAAAAFAEQNQSETALYVAGIREPEQKRESARTQKRADTRPRLKA